MDFHHVSVLLEECMTGLAIKPEGIYVDGTAGGAGHSAEIAKRLTTGRLFALDQDPDAVKTALARLAGFPCAEVIHVNFRNMEEALAQRGVDKIDGILLDLGVSSHQLDCGERGFSYHQDAPLDMRMSQSGPSAKDLVNTWSVEDLTRIIREYGEEKFAHSIAVHIEKYRQDKEIETTMELAEIIKSSMPASARRNKNPAKKTFQAIRIAVNAELDALEEALERAFRLLVPGGRMAIITFHSLEDRMVKQKYAEWCKGCICPPDFPQCVCGRKPKARLVNRKPITASEEELVVNHRSRSAKLRVLEKLEEE